MITKRTRDRLLRGGLLILVAGALGSFDYLYYHLYKKPRMCALAPGMEEGESDGPCEIPGPVDETLEIKPGDTFSFLLERSGILHEQIQGVVDAVKSVFNLKELRPDHEVFIRYEIAKDDPLKKDLQSLIIKVSIDLEIVVERDSTGEFQAQRVQKELVQEYRAAQGTIKDSLYIDAGKQGVHPKALHQMIAAFSYDVDFQRSFQPGDGYGILYDTLKEPESLQEKTGEMLYAELNLQGKILKIYRFKPKNGVAQYYNEKGESVKKGLLRTPIDGARIGSGFGNRRHPILGYTMKHKGLDFGAAHGTPIMAAGDGRVARIGPFSTYGNYIKITHSAAYATAYAHMSRFAKGLRAGSAVRQGQVIGYVGTTGRSTGPHLHYEVIKNGVQINPKSITMLPTGKLKGAEMAAFIAFKQKVETLYVQGLQAKPPADTSADEQATDS